MKKIKKYKQIVLLILWTVAFFSATLTVTWDSAHYLSYVDIFEGAKSISSWDIVRGPIFPLFIYIGDFIFGKSAIGILCLFFIIYLAYCCVIGEISKKMFANLKYKKIYQTIFLLFSTLNPVIFGYFHTLLTEIIAIFLMVISCYISYNWINITSKKTKILYSLFYIFMLTFSYFLKQPYICIIFFPLLIASVISLIKNFKINNILYRFGTIFISLLFLITSILLWNNFLVNHKVNMNTGRDSSSILSNQLLISISNIKTSTVKNYKKIKDDKLLDKKEKQNAKKILSQGKKIKLIKIYLNNKELEHDIIYLNKNGKSSVLNNMKEIIYILFKHPLSLIESYSYNYCALSSVCVIDTKDGVGYWVTKKIDFYNLVENSIIGYRTFSNYDNMFYLDEEEYESAKYYYQQPNSNVINRTIFKFSTLTNILYKISILFLPLFLLLVFMVRILKRKNLVNYELYIFSVMFMLSSLCTLICCAIVGQIIDRYSVYCFIPTLMGIITGCIFIIKNIKLRSNK